MRFLFTFLLCLAIPLISMSQFLGGAGSGNSRGRVGPRLLNGSSDIFMFPGGTGKGDFGGKSPNTMLGGSSATNISFGGVGHGSNSLRSSISNLSGQSAFSFPGGNGDGTAVFSSGIISLNGVTQSIIVNFSGGNGNGSFKSNSSAQGLNGSQSFNNFSYFGGNGNGSTRALSTRGILLNGLVFSPLFPGGSGRGDRSFRGSKITLNGVLSPNFLRVAHSAIKEFYILPPVQNKNPELKLVFQQTHNVQRFEVQKSIPGGGFATVSKIDIKSRLDNPEFNIPISTGNEITAFRILQVFPDSAFAYSDLVELSPLRTIGNYSVFPNPVNQNLLIRSSNSIQKIEILNTNGQVLIWKENAFENEMPVEVSSLPPGLYFLRVYSQSGMESLRFSKK